jgi:CDP-diacylglycerol--glycerol-3-phosphate 3-phosphatidyltransferase
MLSRSDFNISNGLSTLRLLLSLPLAISIKNDNNYLLIMIVIVATLSDFFDGYFARRLNQISEVGKILDPLADKIFIIVGTLVIYATNKIPLWFLLSIVLRDILIFVGGIYLKKKKGLLVTSNMLGKVSVNFIALALFYSCFKQDFIQNILIINATLFIITSFAVYLRNGIKEVR